ncbi:MAG: hypothetical protein U0892_11470 [Pirellulales bacterium]
MDEFKDLRTLNRLPKSDTELSSAHLRSRGEACETIAADEPVEMKSFLAVLTERDRRESAGTRLPSSSRQSVLAIGLSMDTRDKAGLPKLSGGAILDYLDKHYVSIQARVRRDWLDRKLYFHHRPIAVTGLYRGSKMSQPFEPVVANAVKEFHSIGLFTKQTPTRLKPEHCRTLVLLFKNNILRAGGRYDEQYEFAFVRGRVGKDADRLETHVFVTSRDRSVLCYINPYATPGGLNGCNIRGTVQITDFDSTGLYPKESVTKDYRLSSRRMVSLEAIDAFCKAESLEGGLHENLDEVLDAIIDERLKADDSLVEPASFQSDK